MQLAHAAPRCASRRSAALRAVAVASVLALSTFVAPGANAAVIPTAPAPPDQGVSDAADGSSSNCTGQPAYKAVIVVGPVGGNTSQFEGWANKIASSASDAGMHVCKVYSPYADAGTLKAAAKGADLFVALMHGNGYPHETSTGRAAGDEPNDGNDDTAHGLGLNASHGSSALRYYGANWVRANLHLAPNGIVILSHMCNTAGNSEDGDKIPDYDLAVDHVDNFAQGFLASTSYPAGGHPSAVMALQSQSFDTSDPRGTLIKTLMTSSRTLDQAFMTTYSRNTGDTWKDSYLPNFGAIGTTDFYVTQRSDGSRLRVRDVDSSYQVHLDPDLAYPGQAAPSSWDPKAPDVTWLNRFAGKSKDIQNPNGSGIVRFGYVRAIAGNLDLRASTWKAGASTGSTRTPSPTPSPDPTPTPTPSPDPGSPAPAPKLTSLRAAQSGDTYTAADEALPIFTPNGDGTGDALAMSYKATASAKLRVTVTDASDSVVRTFSVAGRKGASTFRWNGKTNAGHVAPDGTYTVRVRITGGNSRSIQVKLLTTIKVPRTSRALLDASDGDSLAQTATQSVAVHSTARLLWRILDAHGEVVRTGLDNERVTKGIQGWVWDGRDDSGVYVPDGTYTSMVTATTSRGSYSHQVIVQVMAYGVTGDFHQRPGQWNTFSIQAAESQVATPVLTVKQPGLSSYQLTLKQVSKNRWSAVWKARPGATGRVRFSISGTDIKGGEDSRSWTGTIQ